MDSHPKYSFDLAAKQRVNVFLRGEVDQLGCAIAEQEEGITELTDDHWKLIHYLNAYYEENLIAPMVRLLCKETGFKLKYVYELFPSGPAKGPCKVAGLPKPTGCV